MSLRTAFVGLGNIHAVHAEAIGRSEGIVGAVAYDPRPEAVCSVPETVRVSSLDDILAREDLDVAVVSVPTPLHAWVATRLMGGGLHVLLEKPIATSLEELHELYRQADRAGQICFSALHDSVGEEVTHYVEQLAPRLGARLGRLRRVAAVYHDPYAAIGDAARRRPSLVGSWLDSGSNALSVVARFVHSLRVRSAHLTLEEPGAPVREDLAAHVTFEGYATSGDPHPVEVTIETSWLHDRKAKVTTLAYEHGEVVLEHEARRIGLSVDGEALSEDLTTDVPRLVAQYVYVFEQFIAAVRDGRDNRDFAMAVHMPLLDVYEAGIDLQVTAAERRPQRR